MLQALREIQASPYAKRVFEQIKTQELTKQQELKAKEAEFKAAAEQAAIVSPHCSAPVASMAEAKSSSLSACFITPLTATLATLRLAGA